MLYVQGEEVRMTQLVCVAYFLLFEHILKLKLVDPKITPTILAESRLVPSHSTDFASEWTAD